MCKIVSRIFGNTRGNVTDWSFLKAQVFSLMWNLISLPYVMFKNTIQWKRISLVSKHYTPKILVLVGLKQLLYLAEENYQWKWSGQFYLRTIVSFISECIHDKAFPFPRKASRTALLIHPSILTPCYALTPALRLKDC